MPFTCPGDVVRAEAADEKKPMARLVKIVEASGNRVEPQIAPYSGADEEKRLSAKPVFIRG